MKNVSVKMKKRVTIVMVLMMTMSLGSFTVVPKQRCQRVDVAIMLDSSGSIATNPQISPFRSMKNFVKNLISRMQTGRDRQAVIHFGESSEVVFNFTTFSSKEEMYTAIDDILAFNGNTDIGQGLRMLREVIFKDVNNPGVPKIAIVLTDGRSNKNLESTIPEANNLKNSGVKVFTIGVTQEILRTELLDIASEDGNFFNTANFRTLNQLDFINQVVDKICISNLSPPACSSSIDLVFILDQSRSITFNDRQYWSRDLLGFVVSILKNLKISKDDTRVGLVKFSNSAESPILLKDYNSLDTLANAIRSLNLTGDQTNIASGFRIARTDILDESRGYRPDKVTVALLITDGESNVEKLETFPEASALKAKGVEVFIIGVGTQINRVELEKLASKPTATHLFTLDTFPSLDKIWDPVERYICNATGETNPSSANCNVANCRQCSSLDECALCQNGYSLDANRNCIVIKTTCNVPNCQRCLPSNVCQHCNHGYNLDGGRNCIRSLQCDGEINIKTKIKIV